MKLKEITIKQAKTAPDGKVLTMGDGNGLYLKIQPNGKKYWVARIWNMNSKKENWRGLGTYPEVTLKQAREKNYKLRKSLKTGEPIGFDRETFSTVAAEWLKKRKKPKVKENYLETLQRRLDKYILPHIGNRKLEDLTPGTVLGLCRKIEDTGAIETAHRVKAIISQVFDYAIASDRAGVNPTLALRGALQTQQTKHHAAVTEPKKIAVLLRQIDEYPFEVVRCALKFSSLVFCRPGEIRAAEWSEIDWKNLEWRIPGSKMKMKAPHIVPLASQTVEVLRDLQQFTGKEKWLFPSQRRDGRCMSENTIRVALRSMGYGNEDMTAHGFRSMACTVLYENDFPSDVIERQLAHAERNSVKAAYNRATYLPQRRKLMQWYADWLDEQKKYSAMASA
jgi:integrase